MQKTAEPFEFEVEEIVTRDQLDEMTGRDYAWLAENTSPAHDATKHVHSNGEMLVSANGVQLHAKHIPLEIVGTVTHENKALVVDDSEGDKFAPFVQAAKAILSNEDDVTATVHFPRADLARAVAGMSGDMVEVSVIQDGDGNVMLRLRSADAMAVLSAVQPDDDGRMPGVWYFPDK